MASENKEVFPCLGAVLAGGPGVRIGGKKPWRKVGGRRLVDIALETLSTVCEECVVVTKEASAMADLPYRIITDRWPGQGPLAAIATVLAETRAKEVMIMAVDMPLVNPELIRLILRTGNHEKAVVPMGPKGPEPLLALYRRESLPKALWLLKQGERKPRALLNVVKARLIPWDVIKTVDPQGLSFLNVNFSEDLERADLLAGQKWGL